jgi:2-C-methyl-D-erythritol 4-phosphate cytidylyltransferase
MSGSQNRGPRRSSSTTCPDSAFAPANSDVYLPSMYTSVLILLSGLPGAGKTALARAIAERLRVPLLTKDRIQSALRTRGLAGRTTADGYHLMFDLAGEQLSLGVSVVLDAVFPFQEFRLLVRNIASQHGARFCPIYCFCSDWSVWRERMTGRCSYVPDWTPVGWAEVKRMREVFEPWDPETTLFVDSLSPIEDNIALALDWICTCAPLTAAPPQDR